MAKWAVLLAVVAGAWGCEVGESQSLLPQGVFDVGSQGADAGDSPDALDAPDTTAATDSSDASSTADATPTTPDIAVGEISMIEPGGDTICSRGTPYRFFAFGGTKNKIVLDFQGGGACWNEFTCAAASAIFNEAVPDLEGIQAVVDSPGYGGLYAVENPDHPFFGWHLVHIPYCTGDIHWGNARHEYAGGVAIEHRGYVNATAALDWVYANFSDPEEIFVTGCSAGAYGAILHSAYIAEHYPNATIRVLGDSGAGIITDTFFKDSFPNWNADPALPDWIAGFELGAAALTIESLYAGIANTYPNLRFAQFHSAFDDNQTFYFTAMGGQASEWSGRMLESMASIAGMADNFRFYIAPGPVHCITPYDYFYSRQSDGVAWRDWLAEFSQGAQTPDSVQCSAEECLSDPVCDACAEHPNEAPCNFCSNWPLNQ